MSGIVVPGKFGTKTQRVRNQLTNELAEFLTPYINHLGWDTVCNDLLTVVGGLVGSQSDKPARDLSIAAAYVRKYDWRRAKRMMFAARQGIQPEDVPAEMLRTFEVVGETPLDEGGEQPQTTPDQSTLGEKANDGAH